LSVAWRVERRRPAVRGAVQRAQRSPSQAGWLTGRVRQQAVIAGVLFVYMRRRRNRRAPQVLDSAGGSPVLAGRARDSLTRAAGAAPAPPRPRGWRHRARLHRRPRRRNGHCGRGPVGVAHDGQAGGSRAGRGAAQLSLSRGFSGPRFVTGRARRWSKWRSPRAIVRSSRALRCVHLRVLDEGGRARRLASVLPRVRVRADGALCAQLRNRPPSPTVRARLRSTRPASRLRTSESAA
jgi:hypothetical protein